MWLGSEVGTGEQLLPTGFRRATLPQVGRQESLEEAPFRAEGVWTLLHSKGKDEGKRHSDSNLATCSAKHLHEQLYKNSRQPTLAASVHQDHIPCCDACVQASQNATISYLADLGKYVPIRALESSSKTLVWLKHTLFRRSVECHFEYVSAST